MVLADHNAYLLKIARQPIFDDPGLGIIGSSGEIRWEGQCQAHVEANVVDSVKNNQLVRIDQRVIQLPANIPIIPDGEDMVTFRSLWGDTTTLKVFRTDLTDRQFGKIAVICRLS